MSGSFHYCRRRRYYARFRSNEVTAQTRARPFRRETPARVWGAAREPRRLRGRARRRRRRDPQAPRRVHGRVGRDRARAEHAAARLGSTTSVRASEQCPFCPGGVEVPFSYEAAVFDNRFPSFRPDPPAAPLLDGTDRARRTGAARSFSTPTGTTPRSASSRRPSSRASSRSGSTADASSGRIPPTLTSASSRTAAPRSEPPSRTRTGRSMRSTTSRRSRRQSPRPTAATACTSGGCLSCEATQADDRSGRVVSANESFVVAVPFAARWPFEVAVRARRHGLGAWPTSSPRSSATSRSPSATSLADTTRSSISRSRT